MHHIGVIAVYLNMITDYGKMNIDNIQHGSLWLTNRLTFIATLNFAGEACWWTIHPASKQRSEGEKVRIGDDLILVSVSSERYLVSSPWWTTIDLNVIVFAFGFQLLKIRLQFGKTIKDTLKANKCTLARLMLPIYWFSAFHLLGCLFSLFTEIKRDWST